MYDLDGQNSGTPECNNFLNLRPGKPYVNKMDKQNIQIILYYNNFIVTLISFCPYKLSVSRNLGKIWSNCYIRIKLCPGVKLVLLKTKKAITLFRRLLFKTTKAPLWFAGCFKTTKVSSLFSGCKRLGGISQIKMLTQTNKKKVILHELKIASYYYNIITIMAYIISYYNHYNLYNKLL